MFAVRLKTAITRQSTFFRGDIVLKFIAFRLLGNKTRIKLVVNTILGKRVLWMYVFKLLPTFYR